MKVALLEGGRSLERGVSMRSSARIRESLSRLGHETVTLDADRHLIPNLRHERPDVAFIALHGREGEDGTVQRILELLDIPHTGSPPDACARTIDKSLAKHTLVAAGLPTPAWVGLGGSSISELGAVQVIDEIGGKLGWPLIVKPAKGGSALGVRLARSAAEAPAAILAALSYDDSLLIEEWVDGRDLAIAVFDSGDGPVAMPPVEAVPTGDTYDFEARYEIGATRFECPARLDSIQSSRAAELAVAAFTTFGCSGVARVDMLMTPDGDLTILEVDTVPGMTQTSLVPLAAEAAGIDFDEFVRRSLEHAIARS